MVLGNAAAVGFAIIIVSLLSHERFTKNKGGERIANTFQRWLLLCILIAYFVTSTFTYILQNAISAENTSSLLSQNLVDVSDNTETPDDETNP
jgi:hypothetical protein